MAKILGLENRNLEVVVRFRHLSEFSLVSAFLFFFFHFDYFRAIFVACISELQLCLGVEKFLMPVVI